MHGCIKNIIDMAKKAIKYSAFILPFLSICSYGADVQVFKARSGSLPFSAMVVTNVVINWDIPIMPTDITNAVYIMVASATNELDKTIIGRGYIQSLQPALDYTDSTVASATNELDKTILSRGYVTKSDISELITNSIPDALVSNINNRLSDKPTYNFLTNEALYRAVRDLILINGGTVTNYPLN